jgi:hypothetical protein
MPDQESQKKREQWAEERFAQIKARYEAQNDLVERPIPLPRWLWEALDGRANTLSVAPDVLLRIWIAERLENE